MGIVDYSSLKKGDLGGNKYFAWQGCCFIGLNSY